MRTIKEGVKFGFTAGVIIFIFMSLAFFLRAGFDTGMNATSGSVLTVTDWNNMVKASVRQLETTDATTMSAFDPMCDRRIIAKHKTNLNTVVFYPNYVAANVAQVFYSAANHREYRFPSTNNVIDYVGTGSGTTWDFPILRMEKKCYN